MSDLTVTVGTRTFNLAAIKDALNWGSDLCTGIDITNAAKNCQEVRPSPLAEQFDEAVALFEEMEQHQVFARDQGNG